MAEGEWTKNVRKALEDKGKQLKYDISRSNKNLELKSKIGSNEIRPDVIWIGKKGKIEFIFEIDQGAYGTYPKTIYGSMLTGILLSIQEKCKFIEIIPHTDEKKKENKKNVKKVETIKAAYDKLLGHPKFFVLSIGNKAEKKWAYKNTQKEITTKLKKLRLIPS